MGIDADTRKRIRAQSTMSGAPVRFGLKIGFASILAAGGVVLVADGYWVLRLLGIVVIGLVIAHALELQHEALHGIGFTSGSANVVAGVMLGLPGLTSFSAYRAVHMKHHRNLGTADDREFFDYGQVNATAGRGRALFTWFYRISMLGHYRQVIRTAIRAISGRRLTDDARVDRGIRRDLMIMSGAVALASLSAVVFSSWLPFWLWFLPLLLVAGPVHALIEMPEHYNCEANTRDPLRNTRTLRSNRFMTWFTNGNNFHVEHHLMPSLPIFQLAVLHESVAPRIDHLDTGYAQFFGRVLFGTAGGRRIDRNRAAHGR